MEIKKIKISELKEAEYNPRVKMEGEEFENLKNSIKEFDMVEPIVVNQDMTIIGGHQRVNAARSLLWEEVPCIVLNLDKKKEKLLNIALNRIVGRWDESKLAKLIKEIENFPDIKLAGLSDSEIKMLAVQYDLVFGDDIEIEKNEAMIKRMFELQERVPIDVERPNVIKRANKLAFYTETLEEYEQILEFFTTNKKSELDTGKLLKLITIKD